MPRKVFVSGCFDMFHSGHVAFLWQAAEYGDLYVCLGSDHMIHELKGRYPVFKQDERKFMIEAMRGRIPHPGVGGRDSGSNEDQDQAGNLETGN